MRHWSVYDAITHSRYVAVRLATWQERGRRTVDELLCRMGFSQRDCKQDYCAHAPRSCFLHYAMHPCRTLHLAAEVFSHADGTQVWLSP